MKFLPRIAVVLGLAGALVSSIPEARAAAVGDGEEKLPMTEMLQRLEAAISSLENLMPGEFSDFPELYMKACRQASGADLDELARLLSTLPRGEVSYFFDDCFSVYATARIRLRIKVLAEKPLRLEWTPVSEPIPKELADAPASLQEAWKLHRTVIAPYWALMHPFQQGEPRKVPELKEDLRRLLGKVEPRAWEHLAAHHWGHWCGVGSETLYHPRNRGILLSLIEDGRWHEVAGAALDQVPSLGMVSESVEREFRSLLPELFAALSLDPEQVLLGAMLPVNARNAVNGRPVVGGMFHEIDPWKLLAARGSERVVRQCLELIRWQNLDPHNACEFLATALGREPRAEGDFVFSSPQAVMRGAALSDECRKEIVSVFAEYLAPSNSPADLIAALREVDAHFVRELREPLAKLVAHPTHRVAAVAHKRLAQAGLTTGREKIAPATPPLRFRLLLDGEPMRGVKVAMSALVEMPEGANANSPMALAPHVTVAATGASEALRFVREPAPLQERETDQKGEVWYRLEEALEPERIGAVQFRIGPSGSSEYTNPLESILGEKEEPGPVWPGPWIVHQVAVRAGDERVQEIRLAAGELEVEVHGFEGLAAERVEAVLRRVHSDDPFSPERGRAKVSVAIGKSGRFQRLQPGRYKVWIEAPGAANYESAEITVSEAGVTKLDARLEPGRSVKGTVILPDGTRSRLTSYARLYRDGVEVWQPALALEAWQGLAFGSYTARIASTREYEAQMKQQGLPPAPIAKEDRTQGAEISFVIDASTPPVLDLGEVRLAPERE